MLLRKIIGTSGTRILNALSSLVVLWIAANELGASAWGIAGIILLDISLIILVVELMSSALVFYTPRKNMYSMMVATMLWTLLILLLTSCLFFGLSFFPETYEIMVPRGYGVHIIVLVFLNSMHSFNLNVLLGKRNILAFNSLFSLQFLLLLAIMAACVYVIGIKDEKAFVFAMYASYGVPAAVGLWMVLPEMWHDRSLQLRKTAKDMLGFGSMTQLSSIVHLINKRLSYFVIRHFAGFAPVGVYNSGVQLTEGLRLIGQSISLVQYSSISNSNDPQFAKQLSLQLLKFSVILTSLAMLLLIAIPRSVFELILSKDFGDIRIVIISLAPGVIALSANTIFSHYFSGTGQPKYNLMASVVGLAVTLPLVFVLIPLWGLPGAGLSASSAYLAAVVYQWMMFKKLTKSKLADVLLTMADIRAFADGVKRLLHSK
ncbi:MAG: polysaccharide biosynthesis C-terminal domain-containing protein [Bacteroidetes bacterium]|nr:polysaccharide biosynthesis C-terminal domain-containing protein [Bacteroidota bacterium]